MDSESPLPPKRLRGSLHGNVQITECIREFKLPRQFPSMVTKLSTDINGEKRMRTNCQTAVTTVSRTAFPPRMTHSKEAAVPNLMRKIKLKGKDGRDLGEVNVTDLPHNIQGKTICLAKNGIQKQPESLSVADKSKGITIGVLTPLNVLKKENPIAYPSENNVQSLSCIPKAENKHFIEMPQADDSKKTMVIEQKKMSAVMDPQGRPQVLVFQSGKNWHMVKIASTAPPTVVQNSNSQKKIVVGKFPQAGKIITSSSQKQSILGSSQNGGETSLTMANKVLNSNHPSMVVKRWSQMTTMDNSGNAPERSKSKSPSSTDSTDILKPKIEVSRIFGPANGKQSNHAQTKSAVENGKVSSMRYDSSSQKRTNLPKDVIFVMPESSPVFLEEESSNGSTEIDRKTANTSTSVSNGWRRKLLASSKNGEGAKYSATRDLTSAKKPEKKSIENEEKKDEHLSILEKALSTVEDSELRAKALKALAECGIGLERLVPVRPPSEQKAVKDSDTQTPIFGLWDKEEFIYVSKDTPIIERKIARDGKPPKTVALVVGNPHSQDLTLSSNESPRWDSPADPELNEIIEEFVRENEAATEFQRNMWLQPNCQKNPVRNEVVEQLEQDFTTYKEYDDRGLLNIHRAVLDDKPREVLRHLKVLKACRESADIPTTEGETSLELAVRYKVSPKIVKYLLDNGAQPTCDDADHDSALIIASKKMLPILTDLIPYVSPRKAFDNYDSSGFAALHYCAQNGDQTGVKALLQASANVDLRDRRSGRTALFHAIENEHMDLAQMLLDNGAQPNIVNYSGQTVVNLIDGTKHYSLAETLNRLTK